MSDRLFRANANAYGLQFAETVVMDVDEAGVPTSESFREALEGGYIQPVDPPPVPAGTEPVEGVLADSTLRDVPDGPPVELEPPAEDPPQDGDAPVRARGGKKS